MESGGSTVTIASLAAALAQCEVALPEEQLADVLQQGLRLPPGVMECDVTALQVSLSGRSYSIFRHPRHI